MQFSELSLNSFFVCFSSLWRIERLSNLTGNMIHDEARLLYRRSPVVKRTTVSRPKGRFTSPNWTELQGSFVWPVQLRPCDVQRGRWVDSRDDVAEHDGLGSELGVESNQWRLGVDDARMGVVETRVQLGQVGVVTQHARVVALRPHTHNCDTDKNRSPITYI